MEPTDNNAIISDQQAARDKFEQARLSRRAALRKMGITTSMAFFSLFAVDDLARMAIKKMEEHKQTREIGETVAREFKDAGIAFAGPQASSGQPCYPSGTLHGTNIGADCVKNPNVFCDGDGTPASCIALACANYQPSQMDTCLTDAGIP